MDIERQRQFNSYVIRSFRDSADQDYIVARAAHKMELYLQFLWLASQAIEKYIKAILILNKQTSARKTTHDVYELYTRLQDISDICFDFPSEIEAFLKYLRMFGQNRYFEYAYQLDGYERVRLDQAVWFIRRYCQVLRWREEAHITGVPSLIENITTLQSNETLKHPGRFSIRGGFLEKVRSDKKHPARVMLLQHNDYFGRKRAVKVVKSFGAWPQINHTPEIFRELEKYVFFSKKTDCYYRTLLKLPPRK
jgi:HEPN domain-containing protein